MKLTLTKKTGFRCNGPVVIYDFRGVLFYKSDWAGHFKGLFNLPPGVFITDSNIVRLQRPVPTPRIVLPKPERMLKIPNSVIFEFKHNPAKATIHHAENRIVFDNMFKYRPLYEIWFIFYHEMGHKRYQTEYKADLFAAKQMLKAGFNASQVMLAPFCSLSSKNHFRRILISKTLNNAETR